MAEHTVTFDFAGFLMGLTIRNRPAVAAAALCALLLAGGGASPAMAGGDVNLLLGTRQMTDDGVWDETPLLNVDLQNQIMFGAMVGFGPDRWPVRIELGLQVSTQDSEDSPPFFLRKDEFEATVSEFAVGVLRIWESGPTGRVRPFAGGGVAFVDAEIELTVRAFALGTESATFSDTSQGLYAHGGVFWRLGPGFNIGFDGKFVFGTGFEDENEVLAVILDADGDADYYQLALQLGWGWD